MHFPGNSSDFIAVNAHCFDRVTLEQCNIHTFQGDNWDHAFATVMPYVLSSEPGNPPPLQQHRPSAAAPRGAGASSVQGMESASLTPTLRGAKLHNMRHHRRATASGTHPYVATGVVYPTPYGPHGLHATPLKPGSRSEQDMQFVHATLNMPGYVDYHQHAPATHQSVSSLAGMMQTPAPSRKKRSRLSSSSTSGATLSAAAAARETGDPVTPPREPTAIRTSSSTAALRSFDATPMTPYSMSVPAATPFTPAPELAGRAVRVNVARSMRNNEAFAAGQPRLASPSTFSEPDANPGSANSRSSNSSLNSMLSQATAHGSLSPQPSALPSSGAGAGAGAGAGSRSVASVPKAPASPSLVSGIAALRSVSKSRPGHRHAPRLSATSEDLERMRQHLQRHL